MTALLSFIVFLFALLFGATPDGKPWEAAAKAFHGGPVWCIDGIDDPDWPEGGMKGP